MIRSARALFVSTTLLLALVASPAAAVVITVTTNADTGAGSLRQAMLDANSNGTFLDEIRFNLPANQRIIAPITPLPLMSKSMDINGTSQPGYAGVPLVAINGAVAGGTGLHCTFDPNAATLCVIRGLAIHGFSQGIRMSANLFVVESNYIGLTLAGAGGAGNSYGIAIDGSFGTVGGTTAAKRNIISGNTNNGLDIGASATSNNIYNNYIGTNPAGTAAIGNGVYAIRSFGSGNDIGTSLAGAGNVIAGNGRSISLESDDEEGTSVRGNLIGLNAAGNAAIPNHGSGVELHSNGNIVGGTFAGERNVISGNDFAGIVISADQTNNTVHGNYIGTNPAGTAAIGNGGNGIHVYGNGNQIGGTTANTGNLVSGNYGGIALDGTDNVLEGNLIGTNAAGTAAIANTYGGVGLYGNVNRVGGTTAAARNIISGNGGGGLTVVGAEGNVIEGNYIGTNAAGTAAVGNAGYAIRLITATGTVIGGSDPGAGNVISGNDRGVSFDEDAPANIVQGNIIGLKADGLTSLGNKEHGIGLSSNDNLIGGGDAGTGNVIASNSSYGIVFQGPLATNNLIQGNKIGVASDGTTLRGNYYNMLFYGSSGNVIGGTAAGEGNTIAGAGNAGAYVWFGTHNEFRGNSFFSNGGLGIDLEPQQRLTPNDPLDADTGSNEQQNMPVISSVLLNGEDLNIAGQLASEASTSFDIDFFSSPACDPSGFGEGKTYLGSETVMTNASGIATITTVMPVLGSGDTVITATATGPDGDTSEFSPCATIDAGPGPGTIQFSQNQYLGYEETGSVTITVARTGGVEGAVSVHYATADNSAVAPADYTAVSGTLSFADGEFVKSFNVPLVLDGPDGGNQQIDLVLTDPTGGATLGSQATSKVLLFDYNLNFPGVYLSDVTINEGNSGTKNADFTVTLTPTDHVVTFQIRTKGGTATEGEDFEAVVVDMSFNPGDAPKTVSVPIIGDTDLEPLEAFYLEVSGQLLPGGYSAGFGHGYIVDNDTPFVCGNEAVEDPESCDDGNVLFTLGDYCSAACVAYKCGIPTKVDGTLPKAGDSLFVLKAAVQATNCDLRVCDVNDSATVTATDALIILKKAVGQSVPLSCPEQI